MAWNQMKTNRGQIEPEIKGYDRMLTRKGIQKSKNNELQGGCILVTTLRQRFTPDLSQECRGFKVQQ